MPGASRSRERMASLLPRIPARPLSHQQDFSCLPPRPPIPYPEPIAASPGWGQAVNPPRPSPLRHPVFSRRTALQAGAVGLLGLGMNHLAPLRALAGDSREPRAKAVIYIFLSGGLSQIDSFDLKPDAPAEIRGEFQPIATDTPGLQIC